ncbi:MAG: hypothetical protein GAK29_00501 [Acinetobacter bereziniae]|uniref:Uncharacterized protein n=1 Tax=Acinetobacter bereziniae TaxID=106648 RepID=A0A833PHX5_ACIBZ|nr:MAG: hypothetical protein GAK29_00501 [Acinetobacter bereziniae]
MKSWTKFILIPLFSYIFINTVLFLSEYTLSQNASLIYILCILLVVLLLNSSIPYLMLRLAPKAPYTSMLLYMLTLLGCIYSMKIYLSNQNLEINATKIGVIILSIIIAMMAYFFFNDPRYKVTYGKSEKLKSF